MSSGSKCNIGKIHQAMLVPLERECQNSSIFNTLVEGVQIHRTECLVLVRSREFNIIVIGAVMFVRVSQGNIESKIIVEGGVVGDAELSEQGTSYSRVRDKGMIV